MYRFQSEAKGGDECQGGDGSGRMGCKDFSLEKSESSSCKILLLLFK